MAGACIASSSSCWNLTGKFKNLTVNATHSNASFLSFSANISLNLFSKGAVSLIPLQRPLRRLILCEAAPQKKADSAAKRAWQAEKKRIYNKARKSEVKTRMKNVLEALDILRKKPDARPDEVLPIEKLIAEAYSIIDKAVKVGTLHRNMGARRKSCPCKEKESS